MTPQEIKDHVKSLLATMDKEKAIRVRKNMIKTNVNDYIDLMDKANALGKTIATDKEILKAIEEL